jgi:hypothetical protein
VSNDTLVSVINISSLVRPILEYGSACWNPCRERQINALDRVQRKSALFTNYTKGSEWETLAQRRTITRLCALFKAYSGKWVWKTIRDRLRRPCYLSRFEHVRKIKDRKHGMDIGKYSVVNRTIKKWNQLSAETLGNFLCKPKIFRNGVRKAIIKGRNERNRSLAKIV